MIRVFLFVIKEVINMSNENDNNIKLKLKSKLKYT